jgi:hypothetical protein
VANGEERFLGTKPGLAAPRHRYWDTLLMGPGANPAAVGSYTLDTAEAWCLRGWRHLLWAEATERHVEPVAVIDPQRPR